MNVLSSLGPKIRVTNLKDGSDSSGSNLKRFYPSYGLYNYRFSNGKFEKIFWQIIVLLASCGLIYSLIMLLMDFSSSPKATLMKLEARAKMELPAVTICPPAPLIRSYLRRNGISDELAAYSLQVFRPTYGNYIERLDAEMNMKLEKEYQSLIRNFSREDIRELLYNGGAPCVDFIKNCTVGNETKDCCAAASPILDSRYGLCWLHKVKPQEKPFSGLRLDLSLDMSSFFPPFGTPVTGVYVRLQPVYSDIDHGAVLIPGGVQAVIRLEKIVRLYQNTLWETVCLTNHTKDYSTSQCKDDCYRKESLEICGCHELTPVRVGWDATHEYRVCSPKEIMDCMAPIEQDAGDALNCSDRCLPSCVEETFVPRISYLGNQQDTNDTRISIDIAFVQLTETVIAEVLTATPISIISNVGGMMGVFLGASLITVVETIVSIIKRVTAISVLKYTVNCVLSTTFVYYFSAS